MNIETLCKNNKVTLRNRLLQLNTLLQLYFVMFYFNYTADSNKLYSVISKIYIMQSIY